MGTFETRHSPDDVVLYPCSVDVYENEHGTSNMQLGEVVTVNDKSLGYLWHDGNLWCWKTPNASAYGRQEIKRFAIAALLEAVQA